MKRLSSSDSLGALMSVCPTTEEQSPRNNHVYGRDFRSLLVDGLEEEGCVEESGHVLSEKKRRLSVEQVKALEKNFEVENKLEPERKVTLAQELGLQPRQVAVWFQNRRARWKTKQLERDYGLLKANYDAVKLNYEALQRDNESLLKEMRELKSKLQEENCTESNLSVKEELIALTDSGQKQAMYHDHDASLKPQSGNDQHQSKELNLDHQERFNNNNGMFEVSNMFPLDFKDGSSDSDSSAILNDEITNSSNHRSSSNNNNNNNNGGISSLQTHQLMNMSSSSSPSSSSMNCIGNTFQKTTLYQPQFVKIEEHNFFTGEETCNFFSDEQAPTLHWYCAGEDQWN